MAKDERPIIIIKKVIDDDHDDHHGGAWKVAYADFVTAMMAFFLLMWILSSVEEKKLEGLADFFTPTISIQSGLGGDGPLDGVTIGDPGTLSSSNSPANTVAIPDIGKTDPVDIDDPEKNSPETEQQTSETENMVAAHEEAVQTHEDLKKALKTKDEESFEELEQKIVQAMNEVPDLKPLIPNVIFDKTDEGLRIQIIDQDGRTMFKSGSARIEGRTKALMQLVGASIAQLPNKVIISGHTDAVPYSNEGGETGYGNWELSADRANSTRRIFLTSGIERQRIARVSGLADTEPLKPEDPTDASNRRISVVLQYAKAPDLQEISEVIQDAMKDIEE